MTIDDKWPGYNASPPTHNSRAAEGIHGQDTLQQYLKDMDAKEAADGPPDLFWLNIGRDDNHAALNRDGSRLTHTWLTAHGSNR